MTTTGTVRSETNVIYWSVGNQFIPWHWPWLNCRHEYCIIIVWVQWIYRGCVICVAWSGQWKRIVLGMNPQVPSSVVDKYVLVTHVEMKTKSIIVVSLDYQFNSRYSLDQEFRAHS